MGTEDEQDTWCIQLEIVGSELMPDYKTVKLHEDTHERLQQHGRMDESFNDLINRILDDWEEQEETGNTDS